MTERITNENDETYYEYYARVVQRRELCEEDKPFLAMARRLRPSKPQFSNEMMLRIHCNMVAKASGLRPLPDTATYDPDFWKRLEDHN